VAAGAGRLAAAAGQLQECMAAMKRHAGLMAAVLQGVGGIVCQGRLRLLLQLWCGEQVVGRAGCLGSARGVALVTTPSAALVVS
jgi:hypothetical protein